MIFQWLHRAIYFVLRLLIPAPDTPSVPQIDVNAPCPSCGHRDGMIRAVMMNNDAKVQHECKVCGAKWYEKPILHAGRYIKADAEPETKE